MTLAHVLRETRYLMEYLLLWPIITLLRGLSESSSRALVRGISRVGYRLLTFDRQWALKNLELVVGPHLTPAQRTRLAMKSFENNALTILEAIRWTPEWMSANVVVEGWDDTSRVIREAARKGKGFIIISAHLGNFELLAAHVYSMGAKCTVLYLPQNNWRLNRLLGSARTRYMSQPLPRGPYGLLKLRGILRRGEGVGLAIDQNTLENPVFVDFLGISAASPAGAAVLARATDAPVMLAVSLREPDGRHRLIFHPPFPLVRTGDRDSDIRLNTQQFTKAIETYVLAYPDQYNWQHPRWRHRPDGSNWQWDLPIEKVAAERLGPARAFAPISDLGMAHFRAA